MSKAMSKQQAPPHHAAVCDEVSELASDLAYSLHELEQSAGPLAPDIAATAGITLRRACDELGGLIDSADRLIPHGVSLGIEGRHPAGR